MTTNFEHYKEELIEKGYSSCNIYNLRIGGGCCTRDCLKCIKDSWKWLAEEYQPPKTKTKIDKKLWDIIQAFGDVDSVYISRYANTIILYNKASNGIARIELYSSNINGFAIEKGKTYYIKDCEPRE